MSNKQGNIKDYDGNYVSPTTVTHLVYDAAKNQALSQTLADTPDRTALGFPVFSTVTAYSAGDIVFYNNGLWKFIANHDAGAWNGAQVEAYSVKDFVDDSVPEDAQLAENIKSWAERDALNVGDEWADIVRTTAGDQSVDSTKGARVLSIVAQTDFAATSFKTTGFNLLHNAVGVGDGFYFLVPALPFGVFGTASQPNGILFTSNANQKLTPTVRFKALSAGVPSSVNDGSACSYTDSNGYRFYTTDQPGYMIVSGITLANTCAHVAWSRRYDEFISPTSAEDAGSTVSLTSILAAVHSDVSKLLAVGRGASLVSDRIDFDGTKAVWTRKVARVQPTWTRSDLDPETGLYTYTAAISGMLSGGLAEFETEDIELSVDGTNVSYQSESGTAVTDYVKYQLATQATGNVTISNAVTIEDWGLEILVGASGSAIVTTQYAQSYPDALAQLLAKIDNSTVPVISEAVAALFERVAFLEGILSGAGRNLRLTADRVDADYYLEKGVPRVLFCTTAGAPNASVVPDNWDNEAYGLWAGAPRFVGQVFVDQGSSPKKVYYAATITTDTSGWIPLN